MLTADLVTATVRAGTLKITKETPAKTARMEELAQQLLEVISHAQGSTGEELNDALKGIVISASEKKLFLGLKKLVVDDCEVSGDLALSPPDLRAKVFEEAARIRRAGERFERGLILEKIAADLELEVERIDEGLFGDLKSAKRIIKVPTYSASQLLERYRLSLIQATLLKALSLKVIFEPYDASQLRQLLRRLKFRQLLVDVHSLADAKAGKAGSGGKIPLTISGPYALFEQVTRYGLALAQAVPFLLQVKSCELEAELLWGTARKKVSFSHSQKGSSQSRQDRELLSEEVETIRDNAIAAGFEVSTEAELSTSSSGELLVPDLLITVPGKRAVRVEVMGFFSRDALWRRIALAEELREAWIFVYSEKLRVKEELVDDSESMRLVSFKSKIRWSVLESRIRALAELKEDPIENKRISAVKGAKNAKKTKAKKS